MHANQKTACGRLISLSGQWGDADTVRGNARHLCFVNPRQMMWIHPLVAKMLVVNLPSSPQALPPQILSAITTTQNRKNCLYLLFLLTFSLVASSNSLPIDLRVVPLGKTNQWTSLTLCLGHNSNRKLFCVPYCLIVRDTLTESFNKKDRGSLIRA